MNQARRLLQFGRLLLVAALGLGGIYLSNPVLATEITVIEQGDLFYLEDSSVTRSTNAQDKQPVFSGTNLFGDSIQVQAGDKGARFRYQCKRGKPVKAAITLERGARKSIKELCPNEPGPSLDPQDRILQSSDVDPEIPWLISPRYTLLRHPNLFLAWRAMKGAKPGVTRYDITLYKIERNERKRVWTKSVLATGRQIETISYPDTEVALQHRVAYKLVIKACFPANPMPKCVSSEDEERSDTYIDRYPPHPRDQFPISGLTFELMNPETNKIIFDEDEPKDLATLMGDYDKGFYIATAYYDHRLYAESIRLLGSFDLKHLLPGEIFGVSRYLRCAYAKVGLYDLALDSLEQSVKVSSLRKPNYEVEKTKKLLHTLRTKQQKSFKDFCPPEGG